MQWKAIEMNVDAMMRWTKCGVSLKIWNLDLAPVTFFPCPNQNLVNSYIYAIKCDVSDNPR